MTTDATPDLETRLQQWFSESVTAWKRDHAWLVAKIEHADELLRETAAELTACRAEQARLTHHATAQVALLQGEIATLRGLVSGVTQTPAEKLAEMERTYYSKGYDRGQRDTCRGCHNCGGALTAGTTHNGPALVCEECHERDVYCEQLEAQVTTLTAALRRHEWQPIDTRPERRKVLVSWVNELGKRRTTCAAWYPAGTLELDDAPEDMLSEDGTNVDEGWFECREAGDAVDWHLNEKVTHWMPLPDPPVAAVLRAASEGAP